MFVHLLISRFNHVRMLLVYSVFIFTMADLQESHVARAGFEIQNNKIAYVVGHTFNTYNTVQPHCLGIASALHAIASARSLNLSST